MQSWQSHLNGAATTIADRLLGLRVFIDDEQFDQSYTAKKGLLAAYVDFICSAGKSADRARS